MERFPLPGAGGGRWVFRAEIESVEGGAGPRGVTVLIRVFPNQSRVGGARGGLRRGQGGLLQNQVLPSVLPSAGLSHHFPQFVDNLRVTVEIPWVEFWADTFFFFFLRVKISLAS